MHASHPPTKSFFDCMSPTQKKSPKTVMPLGITKGLAGSESGLWDLLGGHVTGSESLACPGYYAV